MNTSPENLREDHPKMKKLKQQTLFALAASIFLWTAGCSSTPPPVADTRDADIKAIKDADAALAKDMADKAFDKMANYYAEDATLFTPGAPAAAGKEAIKDMTKMLVTMDLELKFAPAKVDVAKGGDIGFTQGTYTMTSIDPKTKRRMSEKGSYVTLYRKQADGAWKIIEDINTPDSAPVPIARTKGTGKKAGKGKMKK
jgi:uncharacterized protein (TIGR02246 family)